MNLQNIRLIARYESKYICRNPVFLGIAFCGLAVILTRQYSLQARGQVTYWFLDTLPSAIPFVNTYLFMILQSILIILAVCEWRASERRADTVEALRVLPFKNSEYITGKMLGIGVVIIALNLLSMLFAAGINIFASDVSFNGLLYLFYWITLAVPAMLFITGIAMLVTSFVRNRALAILLLTGFVICTLSYLPYLQHGLFDYLSTTVPNVFSEVLGHVDIRPYLLHRTAFLALGIGCLGMAATREKRLPNDKKDKMFSKSAGLFFPLLALATGTIFYLHYEADSVVRDRYRQTALKHDNFVPVHIPEHVITFKQEGEIIEATSQLQAINREQETIKRVILFLNPTLQVTSLTDEQGNKIPHQRENHVITINRELSPGDTISLRLHYQGTIDDQICYLDADDKTYRNGQLLNCPLYFGKRYAHASKAYTLLPPECLWYPAAVPHVNLASPYNSRKDFTRFSLDVIAPREKTVISQGTPELHGDTTRFFNSNAMHGLLLSIGYYKKHAITIDSVNMELYTFKGNDRFSRLFKNTTNEERKKYIFNMKKQIENRFDQRYPYSKFVLAETPLSFNINQRRWESHGDFVQPEIVLT